MSGLTIPSYDMSEQTSLDIMKKDALTWGSYKSKMIKAMDDAFPISVINGYEVYGEFNFQETVVNDTDYGGIWLDFMGATFQEKDDIRGLVANGVIARVTHTWNYSKPTDLTEEMMQRIFNRISEKINVVAKVEVESYCKGYSVTEVLDADRLPISFTALYGQNIRYRFDQEGLLIDSTEPIEIQCALNEVGHRYRISKVYDALGQDITSQMNSEAKDWLLMLMTTSSSIATELSTTKGTVPRTVYGQTTGKEYELVQSLTEYDISIPSGFIATNWTSYKRIPNETEEYYRHFDSYDDLIVTSDYGLINTITNNHRIIWATLEAERSYLAMHFFIRSTVDGKLYMKKLSAKRMKKDELGLIFGDYIDIIVVEKEDDWSQFKIQSGQWMQDINYGLGKLVDFLDEFPIFKLQMDLLVSLVSMFDSRGNEAIRQGLKDALVEVIKWVVIVVVGFFTGGTGWVTGISSATGSTLFLLITEMVLDILSLFYSLYTVSITPQDKEDKTEEEQEVETEALVTKDAESFNDENEMMYNGQFRLLETLNIAIDKPYDAGSDMNQELNKGGIQ